MRLRFRFIVLVIVLVGPSEALTQAWTILAPDVLGFRISGPLRGGVPAIIMGQRLWITLDAAHTQPRDLRVEVVHCDRNWNRTTSEFINDPFLIRGRKEVSYAPVATGVRSYRWTYATSIPAGAGLESFRFSGNYRGRIVDEETSDVLVTFRFIVAEASEDSKIRVALRRLPMKIEPWNQAHAVTMYVGEKDLDREERGESLQMVRVVDIYRNREWDTPYRVDLDALTPETWVDGLGTPNISFTAGDVMPGNEYRTLDIRSVEDYPESRVLRALDGADVGRFFASSKPDHNGASVIVASRRYADFERFEFQLLWDSDERIGPVYVLGDFNGWTRDRGWMLTDVDHPGRFTLHALLKRGRYDYEYSVGDDTIMLEGNSWDTSNLYTGVVYYSDPRMGGFDRILFVSQVVSGTDTRSKERDTR